MSPSRFGEAVERVKSAVGQGDDVPKADGAEGPVAVVRGALRAWGEGNFDEFFAAFEGDVEWVAPQGSKFPAAGTIHGRDELRDKLVDSVKAAYQEFGFRPAHFLEAEQVDWIVVLGTFTGTPLAGHELDVPGVMVWEMDGERAERVRVYTDSELFHEPAPDKEERERDEREHKEKQERERSSGQDDEPKGEGGEPRHEESADDPGGGSERVSGEEPQGQGADEPRGEGQREADDEQR